jgi:hypothetical protein
MRSRRVSITQQVSLIVADERFGAGAAGFSGAQAVCVRVEASSTTRGAHLGCDPQCLSDGLQSGYLAVELSDQSRDYEQRLRRLVELIAILALGAVFWLVQSADKKSQ